MILKNLMLFWMWLVAVSCSQPSDNQTSIVKVVAPEIFKQKLSQTPDAILVDVRTPAEWSGGVLENAQQMNYQDADFEQRITALDKSKPVFVYCKLGGRSGRVTSILEEAGFQQVYDLDGGIVAWQNQGFKVVSP